MRSKVWAEIRTLLWLQFRLTRAVFRGRQFGERLHALNLAMRAVSFVFSLPLFLLMGAALAVALAMLSPQAAYELAMIVNVGLGGFWLLLPASYGTQTLERFEMTRLFAYPIRFQSIVLGSVLTSALTMTGLWTLPLLIGEVIGLAWHRPVAVPLIVLGAVPTYALLVLAGRIIEDVFDLVSGDRRLRALMLALLFAPLFLCWIGQYGIQFATDQFRRLPRWGQLLLGGLGERLGRTSGLAEFLETLRASRLLIWLPLGWSTTGMAGAIVGEWSRSLLFALLSTVSVGVLVWVHAGIVRHLNRGGSLRAGAGLARDRRLRRIGRRKPLPGPTSFWGLLRKDAIYLRRSPLPRRLLFSALLSVLGMVFAIARVPARRLGDMVPLAVVAFSVTVINLIANLGLGANYFGSVDREGYAAIAHTGVDRRQILCSANLVSLVFVLVLCGVISTIVALVSQSWAVLAVGLYLGLCIQLGGAPAYNLAAILAPYRAQLRISGGRKRGNVWGLLAWLVSGAPVLALTVLPYLYWRPGLALTLPLGFAYCVGLYLVTLKPLAELLQRREHHILYAVSRPE